MKGIARVTAQDRSRIADLRSGRARLVYAQSPKVTAPRPTVAYATLVQAAKQPKKAVRHCTNGKAFSTAYGLAWHYANTHFDRTAC